MQKETHVSVAITDVAVFYCVYIQYFSHLIALTPLTGARKVKLN